MHRTYDIATPRRKANEPMTARRHETHELASRPLPYLERGTKKSTDGTAKP